MISSTNISIKDLAAYCLDYSRLVSSNSNLSRVLQVELNKNTVDIGNIIAGELSRGDSDSFEFDLITDVQHDINMLEELKTREQKEAEKRLRRDRKILASLTDINNKIKTQEYTKKIVLETGVVKFSAKRIDSGFFGRTKIANSDMPEDFKIALIQLPVSLDIEPKKDAVTIHITITDPYLRLAIEPFNGLLKQSYYDDVFELVTKYDSADAMSLPVDNDVLNSVWTKLRTYLLLMEATDISSLPDLSYCTIKLSAKTNYFLVEDLSSLTDKTDVDMENTSLGAWSSDEEMNIEYDVSDDGRTEIFFPFPYDKYQLKVLGIIDNKSSIVEGPPGTGKSQTIANILCHLAATGKKVLFVSQKDQAVRGVKDKLKSLDIPFLFGYIPDRSSPLYTEDDERDSAVNVLKSFQKTYAKMTISDQKAPLRLIRDREKLFSNGVDGERKLFDYYNQRRALSYVEAYATLGISREWWTIYSQARDKVNNLIVTISEYENNNRKLVEEEASVLKNINIDYVCVNEFLSHMLEDFSEIIPERSGSIKGLFVRNKMNGALKKRGRVIIQEVYGQVESIVFSEETKTSRLRKLQSLKDYFENCINKSKLVSLRADMVNMIVSSGMSQNQVDNLSSIISSKGEEKIFSDIDKYIELNENIDNIDYFSANELNEEIKELQKYYKSNVCNYIRNRILKQIDVINSQKSTKAILNRVANSLARGKKAYKTFDKLKNGEDGINNFMAMSEAIPIWMMGLEDVSRIIPMVANAFDYVILDEASQCNLAYSLPVMYRGRHTVFFGDSLQMRDTNILFKSNQQLESIAKKNRISDYYQIKATEDSVKSVMDIATLAGFKTAVLRYHYRSPKELIGFSNSNFYEAVGRSLEVVNDSALTYKDTNRVLVNHIIEARDENEDSGKRNFAEVEYIKNLIEELKKDPKTKDKSIAILTFFNEQAELLRQSIEDEDIKVSTIEGIQGDERDIVIYSFVIRDPSEKKRYVALTGEGGNIRKGAAEGRVNVAFSRAKLQVHCVTSLKPELWPEGIWIKRYLEYVDKNGIFKSRNSVDDQIFDSEFEKEVFGSMAEVLDDHDYYMETQVQSCGFRIDLVIGNRETGRKIAIECDGPTHFENGDGQVYIKSDWERQMILETAGWHFYRISYFDWMEEREETLSDALKYIYDYLYYGKVYNPSVFRSIEDLHENESLPEEPEKKIYTTSFSDDKYLPADSPSAYRSASGEEVMSVLHRKREFTVGNRGVDQIEFEEYLHEHIGKTITIRYQSTTKGSSHKWRYINMEKYDSTYILTRHEDGYLIKYRRDRVVDFK